MFSLVDLRAREQRAVTIPANQPPQNAHGHSWLRGTLNLYIRLFFPKSPKMQLCPIKRQKLNYLIELFHYEKKLYP